MPNVQSIPEGKGTSEEHKEYQDYLNGEENLRHEGISPLKGEGYDPNAGPSYPKTARPEPQYGPLLVTDPGQPKGITAKGISRQNNSAIERQSVVSSEKTGRKPANAKRTEEN